MYHNATLNTLEELVSKALEQATYMPTPTYILHEISRRVYVDEQAGQAWLDAVHNMRNQVYEEYQTWEERDRVEKEWRLSNPEPEKKYVCEYLLERTGSRHGAIDLGTELGAQIAKVWTRKPLYKGDTVGQLTGMRSLKSIAALLGKQGMDKEVKAAQVAAEAAKQLQTRNSARRNIAEALVNLGKAIDQYGPTLGISRDIFDAMALEAVIERKD